MQARMKNPAAILDSMQPSQAMWKAAAKSGLAETTMHLVHLRVSQINGCGFCVLNGAKMAKKAGETEDRLFTVAAWREATCFTDAERAALALAESVTRIADSSDPVPDAIWDEATKHYDETKLAGLLMAIATVNVWNRFNVPIRQPAVELKF